MKNTIISVDLAKNVFEVAISRRPGTVSERHRLTRRRFLAFFAQHQPATVLLEACGSAHYWARELRQLGHSVGQVRSRRGRGKDDPAGSSRAALLAEISVLLKLPLNS